MHVPPVRGEEIAVQEWRPACGTDFVDSFDEIHGKLIQHAAFARNLKVSDLSQGYFQISNGERQIIFYHGLPETTSAVGRLLANDKAMTKQLLERSGFPTPEGRHFRSGEREKAWLYAQSLGWPVVIKPLGGSGGKGVSTDINGRESFMQAWNIATRCSRKLLIVERHISGKDYRLLVVGDKVIAAFARTSLTVTGDGVHSIKALFEMMCGAHQNLPQGSRKISFSQAIKRRIHNAGLTSRSILPPGKKLQLCDASNLAQGGENDDVPLTEIHPSFLVAAQAAIKAIPGLTHCGVDMLIPDIQRPATEQHWVINELNANPSLAGHHFPTRGIPRDCAGYLIEQFFPEPVSRNIKMTRCTVVFSHASRDELAHWLIKNARLRSISGNLFINPSNELEASLIGSEANVDDLLLKLTDCMPGVTWMASPQIEDARESAIQGFSVAPELASGLKASSPQKVNRFRISAVLSRWIRTKRSY